MKKFEYFIINLIIFISPFVAKIFYPFFVLPKSFQSLLSIFLVSIFFIIWDQLVTNHWWRFNKKYLLGFFIGKLPLEEILFFPIVSLSCLIIWVNLNFKFKNILISDQIYFKLLILMFVFLGIFSLYFAKKKLWYTMSVFLIQALTVVLDFFLKTKIYQNRVYYLFLIICLFLTFIFNYYLTKRPIVIYYQREKTERRILTIPIEDFIYGVNLLTLVIVFYHYFLKF